jgi:hypothetical protein
VYSLSETVQPLWFAIFHKRFIIGENS